MYQKNLHSRQSKGPKANRAGLCVRQMTLRLDLCILNGSRKGDLPRRKSIVDYWIISYDLQKFLQKMEVDSRLESDHNSVILTLTLHQNSLRTASNYLSRLESQNTQVKIKWTEKNAKEVTKWMLVPETIELRTSLLKNKFEGSYLEGFETLISNLKSVLTNRILAQSKKLILKSKNWFDRDCMQLKRTYNKEYRKSKNAPSEDHTHYLKQLKAQYKTLLKEKKSAALKESWHRLIAAVDKKYIPFLAHH
ncbi:hypothetical protein L345_18177, partial [Ophiophagus hannah]